MTKIYVQMKRGGKMPLEATGSVSGSDEFGAVYAEVTGLYWPRKHGDRKSYLVKESLVASWDQVVEAYIEAQ